MNSSAALVLARALKSSRSGCGDVYELNCPLTASQAGCSIRLVEVGAVTVHGDARRTVTRLRPHVEETFRTDSPASGLLGESACLAHFESIAGPWFDMPSSEQSEAFVGYWLADMFLKSVSPSKAQALTTFLVGRTRREAVIRLPSVRRYPTGGVSEKQALILPPLLHGLSKEFGWCSSFLVAPKLAHTGGTRDKLSVLPNFAFVPGRSIFDWTGRPRSVVYFSADDQFCPRDARMYRFRSETGAVADFGLMAASIMSKQISSPADIIVLDIIYGPSAFIESHSKAVEFGELCRNIGAQSGVKIRPLVRFSDGMFGYSIGANTEILEAADILRGDFKSSAAREEFQAAIRFLSEFADGLGLDVDTVANAARELVSTGKAFGCMLELWAEHGVAPAFLDSFRRDSCNTLLGRLSRGTVKSLVDGYIRWNPIALADIVNSQINLTRENNKSVVPGGVQILCADGDWVAAGQIVAHYFCDFVIECPIDFSGAYVVKSTGSA